MLYKLFTKSLLYSLVSTILLCTVLNIGQAQVRSSTNYKLQSDSINIGGGFSSSTSYVQESTAGEIATGPSDSPSYSLRAGYQQMQEVYISLATAGDVVMSPDLPGLTGGTSNGSTTFTVVTDSPSGYSLTIEAENNPAMQNGPYSIADYDAGVDPDPVFTIGGGNAFFGFTPEGVDVVQSFLDDNGGTCNSGSYNNTLTCWDGLSTTAVSIAAGIGSNHPTGATTTVRFRVGIGSGAGVIAGAYTATSTVTALPL